jgi:hypothetical protein
MDSVQTEQGISRRTLLKRVGAGAVIAWSAPIISSFGSKALAGLPGRCNAPCGAITLCAVNRFGDVDGSCGCSADTEGRCDCWANVFCTDVCVCSTSADCPAGWRCIPGTGCGDQVCIPACGQSAIGGCGAGRPKVKAARGATALRV